MTTSKKYWRKNDPRRLTLTKKETTLADDWTDAKLDMVKRKEFNRLRHMVPSIASKSKVPQIAVIEEAIHYIDELHEALAQRVKDNGVPNCLRSVNIDAETSNAEDIRLAIKNWIGTSQSFVAKAVKNEQLDSKKASHWSKADGTSKIRLRTKCRVAPYKTGPK